MLGLIKSILKGIVIGVANIIPGVSGGTMMVSMGIYDDLIHCITHLFSEFKKNVKFLFPIAVGMLLGIVGLSFVIEYLFEKFPVPTNLLFIGLIVGGLPAIYAKVKGYTIKLPQIAAFLFFFALVVGMSLLGEGDKAAGDILQPSLINVFILFLIGIIAAATMVIPGVSGSMVLMLLGFYGSIIATITGLVESLIAFDINGILRGAGVLIPFGVGVIVGVFAIAKLIEIVLAKYPGVAYWGIIGLIAASPFAIVIMNGAEFAGVFTMGAGSMILTIVVGIIALAAGTFAAYKLGE